MAHGHGDARLQLAGRLRSSAHVGGADNTYAPQWRDRIYIVFTRKGIPLPDLKPTPLAWCQACGQDVHSVQTWRNGRKIGKYKQQYDYRCPNTACRHALVEPYVRAAADIIDWTNTGERIGDRKKPLAASTMAASAPASGCSPPSGPSSPSTTQGTTGAPSPPTADRCPPAR